MKRAVLSCFLAAVAVLGLSQQASAATILQFQQVVPFGQPWAIVDNGTSTTISTNDLLVQVNLNPAFCLEPTCGGLPLVAGQYLLDFTATSTGPAVLVNAGQDINQPYAGSMSFTGTGANAGTNLISFSFSDQLAGAVGSPVVTLSAGDPPDLFFNATSSVLDPLKLNAPRGFSIGFSDWQGGLGRDNATASATVSSSFADGAGTLNASPTPIPEPTSMLLLGSGLVGLAHRARRRFRKA